MIKTSNNLFLLNKRWNTNYIALESIGFVWSALDKAWNIRYEGKITYFFGILSLYLRLSQQTQMQFIQTTLELLQYKKENGNALVPHIYPQNEQLGMWVHKQRRNYKVYKQQLNNKLNVETTDTSLSHERVHKLNQAGFVWDVHEAQWLERYEELKQYRKDYGDTFVPRSYTTLGKWVEKQRADYKKYMAKKKAEEGENLLHDLDEGETKTIRKYQTAMNEERIRLLESEDFVWDPFEYAWQMKFEELCEWIALNGHGAIRRGKNTYSPLEGWADHQRTLYKKYLNGEKTSLTEERIEKLQRVGFVFVGANQLKKQRNES